jgi:hypothetical protein
VQIVRICDMLVRLVLCWCRRQRSLRPQVCSVRPASYCPQAKVCRLSWTKARQRKIERQRWLLLLLAPRVGSSRPVPRPLQLRYTKAQLGPYTFRSVTFRAPVWMESPR